MDIQIPTENGNHTLKRRNSVARWGSHSSAAEDSGLLGCDTMLLGKQLPLFQRNVMPLRSSPSDTTSHPRKPESLSNCALSDS
jgi:hypothetical protein